MFLCLAHTTHAAIYQVGPGKEYTKPSDVTSIVGDDDTIEIDAGTYQCDTGVVWRQTI